MSYFVLTSSFKYIFYPGPIEFSGSRRKSSFDCESSRSGVIKGFTLQISTVAVTNSPPAHTSWSSHGVDVYRK